MSIKALFTLCCLFTFPALLSAQGYIDLHYQFKKGDIYSIHQNSSQETYLTVKGVPQRTSNHKEAVLELSIKNILPGGVAEIDAEYKKIILLTTQKNLTVSVNTETEEDDIYNNLFRALIDKPFTIKMEPNGNIEDISGLDAIFDQMIAALPDVKEKEKPILKTFLEKQMGASQVKTSLSLVLPYYPSYKVQTDDSWASHLYTKGFYNGRVDNYWKLTFGTKYMIKLENTGKFGTDPTEVVDLDGGQKGRMNLDGEIKGKYVINPTTNWPASCILHSELNGNFIFFIMKREKKKGELKVPVRVVRNANYRIKHL